MLNACDKVYKRAKISTHTRTAWSVTIIKIMCPFRGPAGYLLSWRFHFNNFFYPEMYLPLLKVRWVLWWNKQINLPVLIWGLLSLIYFKHNLFPGTQTHEYTHSITGRGRRTDQQAHKCAWSLMDYSKWKIKCSQIMRCFLIMLFFHLGNFFSSISMPRVY